MESIHPEYRQLYSQIMDYDFGYGDVHMPFHKRLAMENVWTEQFALRVVEEYKKFLFLTMVAGHEITPSDEVDQAWHLHQIYQKDYEQFCLGVLGRKLYHKPTQGGPAENKRFDEQYTKTKEDYKLYFQQTPPEDIWPDNSQRFGEQFVRVSMKSNMIISCNTFPKLTWFLSRMLRMLDPRYIGLILCLLLAGAVNSSAQRSASNATSGQQPYMSSSSSASTTSVSAPEDGQEKVYTYLCIGGAVLVVAIFVLMLVSRATRRRGGSSGGIFGDIADGVGDILGGCGSDGGSGCGGGGCGGGGCGGCGG